MTPKTEDNPKNEDNLKNEYNLKYEDDLKNEDNSRQIFLQSRAMAFSALLYFFLAVSTLEPSLNIIMQNKRWSKIV